MKKVFLAIIAAACFNVTLPAGDHGAPPAYRVFTSPGISASFANDILAHVNVAVSGYYREYARNKTSMDVLQDEQRWIEFLLGQGLLNNRSELRPREWEEIEYVIFLEEKYDIGKQYYQISMLSLTSGEHHRYPVSAKPKPNHIAKSLAHLLAERLTDSRERWEMKMAINSYFSNFFNFRTIDIYYNGIIFSKEGLKAFPISGGIGLTIPLSHHLGFTGRFSGLYQNQDEIEISSGLGLIVQKASRFSPAFSVLGGYSGTISNDEYNHGVFLEPALGLGLFLSENLKVSATGSFRLSYFLKSERFSTSVFGGVKLSLGY